VFELQIIKMKAKLYAAKERGDALGIFETEKMNIEAVSDSQLLAIEVPMLS
jgi:hypothetical protein